MFTVCTDNEIARRLIQAEQCFILKQLKINDLILTRYHVNYMRACTQFDATTKTRMN